MILLGIVLLVVAVIYYFAFGIRELKMEYREQNVKFLWVDRQIVVSVGGDKIEKNCNCYGATRAYNGTTTEVLCHGENGG